MRQPLDELQILAHRNTQNLRVAVDRVVVAQLGQDPNELRAAQRRLGNLLAATGALADLLGRRRIFLELDRLTRRAFAAPTGPSLTVPDVPFQEAVSDLLSREPRLAQGWQEVQRVWTQERGFALARSASATLTDQVQLRLAQQVREGVPVHKAASELVKLARAHQADWTQSYAQTVYRTNLTTAFTAGRLRQARAPEVRRVAPAFRFDAVGDHDTRKNHNAADGLVAMQEDPVWRKLSPPLGYNCFLPGTPVSGRFVGGIRTEYFGQALEVLTKGGRRLAVTPNHPIATMERGFVRADELKRGDQLLADMRHVSRASAYQVHEDYMPASVEEVFGALAERGRVVPRDPVADDLHGDAAGAIGQIYVVGSDCELRSQRPADFLKKPTDPEFVAMLSPDAGLDVASLSSSRARSLRGVADRAPARSSPRTAALPTHRATSARLDLLPLDPFSSAPPSWLHPGLQKPTADDGAAHTVFVRELLLAAAGEVALDEVLEVRAFEWAGHVYDLQSTTGWLMSSGIVASNCRCTLALATAREARRAGVLTDRGPVAVRPPAGAGPDPGFSKVGRTDQEVYPGA